MTQKLSALFLVGVLGLVLTSKSTLAQGTFNAINDGSWDSPSTWTCISGTCGPGYPTNPADVATITIYTVTTVGTINITSLEIGTGGVLDLRDYTGHTIGTFTGNDGALVRITAASGTAPFPAIATDNYTNIDKSVVEFYGNTSYSIPARQYPTLSITGSNTKTFTAGAVSIVGDLNVEIGAILNLGSANITVTQTANIRGSLIDEVNGGSNQFQAEFNVFPGGNLKDGAGVAIANAYIFFGSVNVLGNFTAAANSANTSTFEFRNAITTFAGSTFNLANNGQYRFASASLISINAQEAMTFGLSGEGAPCVVSANVVVNTSGSGGVITFNLGSGNFTINSGFSFSNNNGSLGITLNGVAPAQLTGAGTWIQNDNAVLNYQLANQISSAVDFGSNLNTVIYGSGGNQSILGTTYHHVTFNNAGTKTLKGNLIANGDLRILGTAILNTLDVSLQRNVSISGNLERGSSAVFNQGTGRVTLNAPTQQSIKGGFTFYKLVSAATSRIILDPTTPI
ncbi:MAG TPA: hypothetical protein DCM08_09155, partial [Microscillaceae bacterium]|nr:hypothetical protein [Microscillaceae bacterium]